MKLSTPLLWSSSLAKGYDPLLSSPPLAELSQNFVIPAYRPLADLWSSAICITSLSTNENGCTITCSKGENINWANTLKVSVNIVLLCLGQRFMTKSTVFSTCRHCLHFFSLHVIVAWSFVRRIFIESSHPLLHRIENNTVRTRNSDLICKGGRGEERIVTIG